MNSQKLITMLCKAHVKKTGKKCECKAKFGDFCGRHNKPTTNNSFGQDVKSRAASSRNGFANSYANNNSKSTTENQVKERNKELGIDPDICMYCNNNPKKDNDHLIPQCCTRKSIYGQNNNLNRVPSCSKCNEKKSGKVNDEFKFWLKDYCKWSQNKIDNLFNWINKNKDNLFIDEEGCNYLENQFNHINMIHDICQKSCEDNEDIMDNIIKYIAQDKLSSEQTTSQIEVVEQQKKELEQLKKELEQLKKNLNDNKLEKETLKQNLETKNKELIDLKKTKN